MNKYYLIIPSVLMAVFFGIEQRHTRERAVRDRTEAEKLAVIQAEKELARVQLQRKAEEDTRQRLAERERLERMRAEKKQRDHEASLQKLSGEADAQVAEAARLTAEVAELDDRIANLRTRRTETEREVFDLMGRVEQHRINRRNADLEVQRATAMIAARLELGALALSPQRPPQPPAK